MLETALTACAYWKNPLKEIRDTTKKFGDTILINSAAPRSLPENVYHSPALDMEAWLCPALMRYSTQTAAEIYVQVRAKPIDG